MALAYNPATARAACPMAAAWREHFPQHRLTTNDYTALARAASQHGQEAVIEIIRWYNPAKRRGVWVPTLARPADLVHKWRLLEAAQAEDVVPSQEATWLAVELGAKGWPCSNQQLLRGVAHSLEAYRAYLAALGAYTGHWAPLALYAQAHHHPPTEQVKAWYTGYHQAKGGRPWCPVVGQWHAYHPYATAWGAELAVRWCGYGQAWAKLLGEIYGN